jgi:hypothetical protein
MLDGIKSHNPTLAQQASERQITDVIGFIKDGTIKDGD